MNSLADGYSRMSADSRPTASSSYGTCARSRARQDKNLSRKLHVGNLSFTSTQDGLERLFDRHGTVTSVNLITDRDTGRARGFGFVEIADAASAQKAIGALDGVEFDGRSIKVSEAQERRDGRSESRF